MSTITQSRPPARVLTIMQEEADAAGISLETMCGSSQTAYNFHARARSMYRIRTELTVAFSGLPFSYAQIGSWFGGRDHTTTTGAINRIKAGLARDAAA